MHPVAQDIKNRIPIIIGPGTLHGAGTAPEVTGPVKEVEDGPGCANGYWGHGNRLGLGPPTNLAQQHRFPHPESVGKGKLM